MFKQEKFQEKQQQRKRGRPIGKNRVPLSLEERRARNAQYERERRNENADAMRQLAESIGCQPSMPNDHILCAAIGMIQRASATDRSDCEHLAKINCFLSAQILQLQDEVRRLPQIDQSLYPDLMCEGVEMHYKPSKKLKRESKVSHKKNMKTSPAESSSPNQGLSHESGASSSSDFEDFVNNLRTKLTALDAIIV